MGDLIRGPKGWVTRRTLCGTKEVDSSGVGAEDTVTGGPDVLGTSKVVSSENPSSEGTENVPFFSIASLPSF